MEKQLSAGSLAHERLGPVWLVLSSRGIVGLHMKTDQAQLQEHYPDAVLDYDEKRLRPLLQQVEAYFDGRGQNFEVDIDWSEMTDFQQQVLQLVLKIPYGQTSTYQDIANQLGQPGAARAVGRANATNPIPIIIPCHRVLGADGGLHGYGGPGGVETKAWLLRLEGSRLL